MRRLFFECFSLVLVSSLSGCGADPESSESAVATMPVSAAGGSSSGGAPPNLHATSARSVRSIAALSKGTAIATCPSDYIVTDGSCVAQSGGYVYEAVPVTDGWKCSARNSTTTAVALAATVYCMHFATESVGTETVARYGSVSAGTEACITASCSTGKATGGGFVVTSSESNATVLASLPTIDGGWETCVRALENEKVVLRSVVQCATNTSVVVHTSKGDVQEIGKMGKGESIAECPIFQYLVGAGFRRTAASLQVTSERLEAFNSYGISATNSSTVVQKLQTTARCMGWP